MPEPSASVQIDAIINLHPDWRGTMLARLRADINRACPEAQEAVKWKKPSRPEGVPVWTHGGNICIAEALKNAVRLTFPHGAEVPDPDRLFNARLDSTTVRAIDFHEGDTIDEQSLTHLVRSAAGLT